MAQQQSKPKTFVGTLTKVGAYPLKEPQEFTFNGSTQTNTHRLAVQVEGDALKGVPDGTYIGFGNTDKDSFIVKDENDKWQILGEGSQVTITYTTSVGGNGVTYFNSKKSNLTVNELVVGKKFEKNADNASQGSAQQGKPANAASYKPKDFTGVQVGHSINCSVDFLLGTGGDATNAEEVIKVAKAMHEITESVKSSHKELNPDKSDYDLSASVGMCVKAAASIVNELGDIKGVASMLLNSVSPAVDSFIRNGGEESAVDKKPVKKTPTKPAKVELPEDLDVPF